MRWLISNYKTFKFFVRTSPEFKRAYPTFFKYLFRLLWNKAVDFLTAEVTENLGHEEIGYLIISRGSKSEVTIKDMFIAPMYRRMGYATDMIKGMMQLYETEGFTRMSAVVSRSNLECVSLLFDLGFEKDMVECNKLLLDYAARHEKDENIIEDYAMYTLLS